MSAAIQLVPNTNLFKQQSAAYPASGLRITLYRFDGSTEVYANCKVLSTLLPELEFQGYRQYNGQNLDNKLSHITATTLPYKIEAVTDVIH